MSMVVECESCGSLFRLSVSLLKEAKKVRFRCRKCGGSITVRNPNPPPVLPDSDVSSEMAAPPLGDDTSSVVRPEIGQPPPEVPVPPSPAVHPAKTVPAPPVPDAPTVPRLVDLPLFSRGKEVGPLKASPPKASLPRRPSAGRNILVAGVSILLLAGGAVYLGTTQAGKDLFGRGSMPRKSAAARPAYDVREMKYTAYEKAVAGNLLVVSGTVANVGTGISRGVRIRAKLLGVDNQVLMENSSLAGNVIDEPTLRHMKPNPIEVYLKMEHREEGEHRDIPPGKSLPFMVVFFGPPEKIGSFTVQAIDAE